MAVRYSCFELFSVLLAIPPWDYLDILELVVLTSISILLCISYALPPTALFTAACFQPLEFRVY